MKHCKSRTRISLKSSAFPPSNCTARVSNNWKFKHQLVLERESSGKSTDARKWCFLNQVSAQGTVNPGPQETLAYVQILGLLEEFLDLFWLWDSVAQQTDKSSESEILFPRCQQFSDSGAVCSGWSCSYSIFCSKNHFLVLEICVFCS